MNLTKEYIENVRQSDYEFWKDSRLDLFDDVNLIHLHANGVEYMGWETCSSVFYDEIYAYQPNLYCFLSSGYWQRDSRVVRHLGLTKYLSSRYSIHDLNTCVEGSLNLDNRVLFWGVVQLTNENYSDLFYLSDALDSGIIFGTDESRFNLSALTDGLISSLETCTKTYECRLRKPVSVNLITSKNMVAIYPYSDEEFGKYSIDLFCSKQIST